MVGHHYRGDHHSYDLYGDDFNVDDIADAEGVAIGREARARVDKRGRSDG